MHVTENGKQGDARIGRSLWHRIEGSGEDPEGFP